MYLPNHEQGETQGQFVKRNAACLKTSSSFSKIGCLTKAWDFRPTFYTKLKRELIDSYLSQR